MDNSGSSATVNGMRVLMLTFLICVALATCVCHCASAQDAGDPANGSYVLGPGDVLYLKDLKNSNSSQIISVYPDGTVITEYTGVIQAAGKTVWELTDFVNEAAKKWYADPQFTVSLAKQRPIQVYLLGEVVHPGLYTIGERSGADASDSAAEKGAQNRAGRETSFTLSRVLQMAGGLKETADVRHLRVTRIAPKQTFQIDTWKLMLDGDVSEDMTLRPGDVVYVPKGGADDKTSDSGPLVNNKPKVRVLGSVKSPGLLSMSPDDDLLSAIAKAGGFAPDALTNYVFLARTNRDGTVSTDKVSIKEGYIDGHSRARQKIHPGDIIIVKRSTSPKSSNVQFGRPGIKGLAVPVGDFGPLYSQATGF